MYWGEVGEDSCRFSFWNIKGVPRRQLCSLGSRCGCLMNLKLGNGRRRQRFEGGGEHLKESLQEVVEQAEERNVPGLFGKIVNDSVGDWSFSLCISSFVVAA